MAPGSRGRGRPQRRPAIPAEIEISEHVADSPEIPLPDPIPVMASQTGSRSRILALAKLVKDSMTLFHGGSDPWLARSWMENLTDTFTYITCTEAEQVELAVFHLRDQAKTWWKTQKTVLEDRSSSWPAFREAFEGEYFSESFCITQRQEFLNLKQGDRSVTEYHTEFSKLSEFCPEMVAQDRSRMHQFIQGLDASIRLAMSSCTVTTYREALDRALVIETTQQQVAREKDIEKTKNRNSQNTSQKRQAQELEVGNSPRRQKGKRSSLEPSGESQQNKSKDGRERKCFQCGYSSHRLDNCPFDQAVCYYCKQPGHMARNCTRRAQLELTNTNPSGEQSTQPQQRIPSRYRAPQQQRSISSSGRMYQIQGREYIVLPVESETEICYAATPLQQQQPAVQTYNVPPHHVQQSTSVPQSQIPTEWKSDISQPAIQPSSTEDGRAYAITREEAQRADGPVFRGRFNGGECR